MSELVADHDCRAILAQVADALIYANREGMITFWNPAAAQLFGFSEAEAVGASLDLIIPEKLRAAHWRGFHAAMARGATRPARGAAVTKALTAAGEIIYAEMSFAVVCNALGEAMGSVAMARKAEKPQPRG